MSGGFAIPAPMTPIPVPFAELPTMLFALGAIGFEVVRGIQIYQCANRQIQCEHILQNEHGLKVGVTQDAEGNIQIVVDEEELRKTGVSSTVEDTVTRLADLAWSSGASGLVASPREVGTIRDAVGEEAVIITPGVRLPNDDVSDQRRVGTPWGAVAAGADFVVMGRSLIGVDDPGEVARMVIEGIEAQS